MIKIIEKEERTDEKIKEYLKKGDIYYFYKYKIGKETLELYKLTKDEWVIKSIVSDHFFFENIILIFISKEQKDECKNNTN